MSIKPSALDNIDSILKKRERKQPLFFLDYDGTLTPIVQHPKDAILSQDIRHVLENLGTKFFTAIVTGRGLNDIKELVPLKNVYFAASHGFILESPQGVQFICPEAISYREEIDLAYSYLCERLLQIPGIVIEHKEFSIAVHDRAVNEERLDTIKTTVADCQALFKGLKVTYGKRVSELRPDIEWDKGKAILWLVENASTHKLPPLPIVIGDDITDEDAFNAVRSFGITICVQNTPRETLAEYILNDTKEVQQFLQRFQID